MSEELPKGFVVDNSDRDELPPGFSLDRVAQGAAQDVGMFGQVAESTARGFFDNAMNLPNAIGDVAGNALAYPAAGLRALGTAMGEGSARFNLATGEPITPWGGFSEHLDAARNTWPASTLIGGIDAPTSFDAQAFARIAPQAAYQYRTPEEYGPSIPYTTGSVNRDLTDLGEQFARYREDALEGYLQRREAQPVGAATGDVLADVATVATGRAPFVRGARNRRLAEMKKPAPPAPTPMDPGFRKWANQKVEGYKDWFKESGYRLGEAGLEGAVLSALQDEDPVTGLAWGVGIQGVNNFANKAWTDMPDFGTKPGLTQTGIKAGVAAFALASLFQMAKELTPGGRDRILESEESGYKKAAVTMAIAAMTNAAGFNRPTKDQLDNLGMIVDTWHSSRRAATLSLISEAENDDTGDISRIWSKIYEDPMYFGETANRRLVRAYNNDDISQKDTIESLMESDRRFRRKVMELRNEVPMIRSDTTRDWAREKYDEFNRYDPFREQQ